MQGELVLASFQEIFFILFLVKFLKNLFASVANRSAAANFEANDSRSILKLTRI